MKRYSFMFLFFVFGFASLFGYPADQEKIIRRLFPEPQLPLITDRTAAFEKLPGWFPLYKDEKAGKIWLEIDKLDVEFLYYPRFPPVSGPMTLV